jgi:hypothetical protein
VSEQDLEGVVQRTPQRHQVASAQPHAGVARPSDGEPLNLRGGEELTRLVLSFPINGSRGN